MAGGSTTWDSLRLLSDTTRVRILALVSGGEELSVAELQEVLGMGQSRISSHLGLLRQGEFLIDRRDGKRAYYALHPNLPSSAKDLLTATLGGLDRDAMVLEDRVNLARVLERRRQLSAQYFDSLAGRLDKNYCPGRTWEGFAHLLLFLASPVRVVDLGAGEGLLAGLLARRASEVVCVDKSRRMVEVGTALAERNGLSNLRYVLGDIESVPLPSGKADLVVLSQALHHAEHPARAVGEAYRLLGPGGRVAILDLREHQFEQARELYADLWLGFTENALLKYLREAGFRQGEVISAGKEKEEPFFETLFATGVRPA
ncbi:MAG: ArsR/SmtB family transcription factor [Puniceicoccaceae bacterium]